MTPHRTFDTWEIKLYLWITDTILILSQTGIKTSWNGQGLEEIFFIRVYATCFQLEHQTGHKTKPTT